MSLPDCEDLEFKQSWEVRRLDELASLVAGLAGRDDISLQFGTRWAWSVSQKIVLVPRDDLHDLNRCRAIASHEVGHVLYTRLMKQMPLEDEYQHVPEVFLHTLHNVFEDPRIENGVGLDYPGARFWLRRLHEEEELDATNLFGLPLAMQFFFGHIREFHRDWEPLEDGISDIIRQKLDETRETRKRISLILPHEIPERGVDLEFLCEQEVLPRLDVNSLALSESEQVKYLAQARMMRELERLVRATSLALYTWDERRIQYVLDQGPITEGEVLNEAFSSLYEENYQDVEPSLLARKILRQYYEKQQAQFNVSTETIFSRSRYRPYRRHRRRRDAPNEQTQSLIRTYDQLRSKIASQIQKMTQELQNVLRPTKPTKWKTGYTSGSKINLRQMIQRDARNQGEVDFWQRKTQPDRRNVAATLLIDLSGSMSGEKSVAALQGAILFWESLHALGVAASVSGFKTERLPILEFGLPITHHNRRKMANMLNLVGSVNNDAVALESAFNDLIAQPADEHVLIVISDGQPTDENGSEHLHAKVAEIKDRVHLIGLGLGEDTGHVVDFYPHAIGNIPIECLTQRIGTVLKKVLRRS